MPLRLQDISLPVPPIPAATTAAAAFSLFLSDPALFALPVEMEAGADTEEGLRIGLVTRARLTEALAGPNGRDVFTIRPVVHLITPQPVIAEASLPAALIAKQAAEQSTSALTDGVIVTENGAYKGIVSPPALLKAIAQENTQRARGQQASLRRIDELKGELQMLAEGRGRFLAFVGHEIRTPLTGILGVADLIKDQSATAETRRLAETISNSGQHLERLLTDLIDLSRLEAGRLPVSLAPFDLRQFAAETRDLWQPKLDAKRVALRLAVARSAEGRIESDAGRLRQILFNLVSNAVKFTDRGHVTVQMSTRDGADGLTLVMTVADTGRGISDADKQRLFEEFEQADSSIHATHGGSGLGLSIARALARRLGGDISLTDNDGGGCVFTVAVPVRKAGPRLAIENPAQLRPGRFDLGEILVAEDHDTTAFVIREALVAAGWRVECVPDASVAAQRIAVRRYQAVVTDVHMPGGGGDAVLHAARFGPGPNRMIPVMALTADASPERRAACEEAGFSGLIEKPVRPRALVAALADALIASTHETQAKAV
ncbi:MAG: hybrid sensor histidine kinase/response regulator [Hyphomonas sp.]